MAAARWASRTTRRPQFRASVARGDLVHGIHIRPGKPTILAICDGKPVFGLPGQPVSVLNTFELFVAPVLRRMLHLPDATRTLQARLDRDLPSADGREDHVRVTLASRDGDWWATPILGVSAMISTIIFRADGIAIIPATPQASRQDRWWRCGCSSRCFAPQGIVYPSDNGYAFRLLTLLSY